MWPWISRFVFLITDDRVGYHIEENGAFVSGFLPFFLDVLFLDDWLETDLAISFKEVGSESRPLLLSGGLSWSEMLIEVDGSIQVTETSIEME